MLVGAQTEAPFAIAVFRRHRTTCVGSKARWSTQLNDALDLSMQEHFRRDKMMAD